MRHRSTPLLLVWLMTLLGLAPLGCQEERTFPTPNRLSDRLTDPPDLQELEPTGDMQAPSARTLCVPSSMRCLAEQSPLFERCGPQGRSTRVESCDPGQVCRQDQCVAFSCVPERPVCVSAQTRALCDPSGLSVTSPEPCAAGQACRNGACVSLCQEAADSNSYIGCSYIAHELFNHYRVERGGHEDSPFAIILANPHPLLPSVAHVRRPDGATAPLIETMTMRPNARQGSSGAVTVRSVLLSGAKELRGLGPVAGPITIPPNAAAVMLMQTELGSQGTFFIESDLPVVAYQFSPYCCNFTATNDASLLLPTTTLQRRYRVLGYPTMTLASSSTSLHPYIAVVAHQDQTQVTVRSPTRLAQTQGTQQLGAEVKSQWSFTLKRGEHKVLSVVEDADLSGALIESDKPIAAFTGHPCTFVPRAQWACDHLEEQLPPADILGRRYLLPALKRRNPKFEPVEGSTKVGEQLYWRLVADADAEIITWPPLSNIAVEPSNPVTPDCRSLMVQGKIMLKAGQACEFGTRDSLGLVSSAPLIVGGVLSGHESTGLGGYGSQAGDPALFILPPFEQFRAEYSFVTAPTFKQTYATVLMREGDTVALDGQQVTSRAQLEPTRVDLDGVSWRMYSVSLEPGVHQLKGQRPFGLIVYAYDDYVSYAFPGGLDLRPRGKN